MDLNLLKDTPPWDWPPDAGKTFLGILKDHQAKASDRLLAAGLAGDAVVIDNALADALLSIVNSAAEPEELRAVAAISLGPVLELADTDDFDDPDAVPISEKTFRKIKQALFKAYLDTSVPKLVRRRVLEAAVRAAEEWHATSVRTAYANEDREWKLTAVFCMCYVRGFEKEILQSLENPDPDIHYQAVRAAANWEVDAAWPHVAAIVHSDSADKGLRLAAIEALGTIRPQESIGILAVLSDDEDEDIAEAASEALSMAGSVDDEFGDEDGYDEDEDEDEGGNRETIH